MTQSIAATKTVTAEQAYEIGSESYAYFYPMVLMDITRKQMCNLPGGQRFGFGPMNTFSHAREYPAADFKAVVRPNFDTLYSSAWLDLSEGPVVLSVPDTNGRYYLLPMLDMWSDAFAVPGWRTSGTEAQTYAIVPSGWSGTIPTELARIESPTPHVWIIGRIKTDGPSDYEAVHAIQDQLKIVPLSKWKTNETVSFDCKVDPEVDMKTPPLETINAMAPAEYFARAAELLKIYKPHATDWSMIARLKKVGFEAGKSFDMKQMDSKLAEAFARGAHDALALLTAKLSRMGTPVNGWNMNTDTMGVYGNYYLKRAIVAMVGLGANQPEDAIYPLNFHDADGEQLQGDKNYILRFPKDQLPPVHAFWSVTMYDAQGFQVANELNRFAVSSWMPLKKNADGSLDIIIQHKNPGPDKESNWLPAPASGILGITMRLYAPAAGALNGDWNPPAVIKN